MSRRAELADLPIDGAFDRDLEAGVPLQTALGDALRSAMLTGRLAPGARLPSSRDLGRQLGIARGTVVAVYDQLASEGYIVARTGSGTEVAETLPDGWFRSAEPDAARSLSRVSSPQHGPRRTPGLSRRGRALATSPFPGTGSRIARPFRAHIPAVDVFPTAEWARLVARRARRDERLLLGDTDVRGYRPLREALAEHLRVARGVVCTADHVVIVPSVQQVLDITARLVSDPGDRIWMEDPGYTGARAVLEAAGARIVPVPVDGHGLDVDAGARLAKGARMAYVTPGHQAPLGVTLTLERRLTLLRWATEQRALVLEDDYDSEYRYEGRPVPALQGLDRAGVVLHTGTFSKTLVPSLRLAYAVVPEALLDPFLSAKSILDRFTPPLTQAVLADFLEGGSFGRHLRRMRELYAERRAALADALATRAGDLLTLGGASAGLELAARLRAGENDLALERRLEAVGVEALALSRHALHRRDVQGLLLGFAAFSPLRLEKSAFTLAEAVRAHVKETSNV